MQSSNIVAGPYLFIDKNNSFNQKTVCIFDNPWTLNTRTYFNGQIKRTDTQKMPDFETTIVKLQSAKVFYEADGYQDKGIGNASKGVAPPLSSFPKAWDNISSVPKVAVAIPTHTFGGPFRYKKQKNV